MRQKKGGRSVFVNTVKRGKRRKQWMEAEIDLQKIPSDRQSEHNEKNIPRLRWGYHSGDTRREVSHLHVKRFQRLMQIKTLHKCIPKKNTVPGVGGGLPLFIKTVKSVKKRGKSVEKRKVIRIKPRWKGQTKNGHRNRRRKPWGHRGGEGGFLLTRNKVLASTFHKCIAPGTRGRRRLTWEVAQDALGLEEVRCEFRAAVNALVELQHRRHPPPPRRATRRDLGGASALV